MPSSLAERGEIVPPQALASLEGEWSALWRRCPGASPFLSPEWILPWARTYAPGRRGAVSLRRDGRLAALLPVFVWRGTLLLAGSGPSDHGGLLAEPASEPAAPELLRLLPSAAPEPFDRVDLQQIAPGSPLAVAPAPSGWRDERENGSACLVARLAGEDGLGDLPDRRRKTWRYTLRRLRRHGGELGLASPDETAAAVADLRRLHGLRWKQKGESGVLDGPLLAAFLGDAAPGLAEAGILRLWQARLGGVRVAVLMVLAGRRAHGYYIGGFDPAAARLSPSSALIGLAMRAARQEGAEAFDFLRGAEPCKSEWGARPRPRLRRILQPTARPTCEGG
jgi:CelD/BcsL family acetyltransferase involved in cellulose biosynthesis